MDDKKLEVLTKELARDIKSEKELSDLTSRLVKLTVETVLNSELDDQLGYQKHSRDGFQSGNNRTNYSYDTPIESTLNQP